MRLTKFGAALVVGGGLLLSACAPSTEADEAAIRAVNKTWQELIVARDAKAIAALYAEDGQMLPPNAPKVVGRPALEKSWGELMATPGMTLTFETEKFTFAKSGDLAVEVGTYKFGAGEGAGAQTDTGKATVTWTKRDGKWFVLTDMFSSDQPAATAAAATETPADAATPATPAAPAETPAPATPPAQ